MSIERVQKISVLRDRLDAALERGQGLLEEGVEADLTLLRKGYASWDGRNKTVLETGFETKGFMTISPKDEYTSGAGLTYPLGPELAEAASVTVDGLRADIQVKLDRLTDLRDRLDLYKSQVDDEVVDAFMQSPVKKPCGSGIFLVHGRNTEALLRVQLLLARCLAADSIVLSEQQNLGDTVLEKLEKHLGNRADYAVILMTGDDEGRMRDGELQPRARQNVVLELGYAMARLGRDRVCLLYEAGVEIPSDIAGLSYYELDGAGGWRTSLLADLRAAGFEVNLDKLLPGS